MNSHQAMAIFVLVCCCGGIGRTVWANIVDGGYYGPHHHQIRGGYLYGTGSYHRGPQHCRNIGLIGNGIGNSRLPHLPALASIATTAAMAMPRNNYFNRGHRPYQKVIIPMSPYFWSAPRSGLHRGNDYYRGLGSVTTVGKNQHHQHVWRIDPKKTRKIVIDGPGGHVSQSFIHGPNAHYGYY